mgnify:CR=1 FL=1
MSKSILTDSQKRDLIKKYQEEVVKLKYQLEKFEDIILELDKSNLKATNKTSTKIARRGRPAKAKVEAVKAEPKRRGRPAKAKVEAVTTKPKRRGRPRKTISVPKVSLAKELRNNTKLQEVPKKRVRVVKNGYKLSPWDEFIINALKEKQHVLISKDLIEISKSKAEKDNVKFDLDEVKNMLNRSLHKMANKRNDLIKTKYEGKGFAYALPNWVNQTNKSLKKKYQRK